MGMSGSVRNRFGAVWRRFAGDRGGAMAMTLGLLMTSFAGMAAISVDVSDWYSTHRSMQAAADAAALGGALELSEGGTNTQAIAAATTDAQLNTSGLGTGTAINVTIDPNTNNVTATLSKHADMLLSGIFMPSAATITASATAGIVNTAGGSASTTPYCLIVTSPSAANVVTLSGSSSIQASGCAVVINSTSTSGTSISGSTTIKSKTLCGPGGFLVSGSSTYQPAATTCSAVSDPYANFTPPPGVSNPCNYTNFQTYGSNYYKYTDQNGNSYTNTTGVSTITLSPGVYCGGINFGAYTNASFQPGIYILRNGGLVTSGNTTATGNGVAFYLTGSGTATQLANDNVNLSASTTLTITAPTTGPMAGIAIFEDRSAATGTLTNTLSGNSTVNFTGLLYFGNQNVNVSGSSENQSAGFTMMVAYTLNYSGYSTLYLNSNYSSTSVPIPAGMKPSSQTVALLQ
jgi:Flp pilus assembly protein TadG